MAELELNRKGKFYKNLFLISTICGVMGIFVLYKGWSKVIGMGLLAVWLVLAVFVRILILRDKKFNKNEKI